MKVKALIPATLLLGFVGAANAQLSLYGLLDGSVGKSIADDAADQRVTFHSGGDSDSGQGNSTSRFGLKGSTDVGSGIKANFKLESAGIRSDGRVGEPSGFSGGFSANNYSSGTPFFNRQAWFGFSGGFGEFRFGRQDSVPFQTFIDFDFNGASNGVTAFGYVNAAVWNRGRESRSLQYISPVVAGVKVQLSVVPDDSDPSTNRKGHGAVGVTYTLDKLAVAGSYESARTDTTERFFSIGASYDFGVAKVMAGYADGGVADTTAPVTSTTDQSRGFNVGVSAPVFGGTVGVLAARNRDTKGNAVEVFANKEVLKNTIAYVEAGTVNSKAVTGKKATGFAVGVIYIF